MVNMTVVNFKDILKYIIKITILIIIVLGITKYVSNKGENKQYQFSFLENQNFLGCLDQTIPAIKKVNHQDEVNNGQEIKQPLKLALSVELGMMNNLKMKEENNNNEKKEETKPIEKAQTGLDTEVQKTNVPEKYTSQYNGVKIKNETDYKLTTELLTPDIKINKENILIYHTHTCESYTPSENFQYKKTGNYRTTDRNYSVVRVGRELNTQLKNYGYHVIHDETYHDYPSYTGSYSNSLATVTKLLETNKNTDVVIDIHRDAIGDYSYAPSVKIGDEVAAQLMFVIGGNGSTIKHEEWAQNLKFAVKVQEKANELYPGLFKPIILRYSGYNQQVAKAATIIEVGSTGNTMEQCLTSMKYLAKVMSEVVK